MSLKGSKNLLVIRPDNMGDLLMSVPAIRAIKNTFGCKITVLCSSKSAEVVQLIEEIDDQIVFDLPWLSLNFANAEGLNQLVVFIKQRKFDSCVVFNVYSQNPAPCIMLAYLAGIKLRAAYSRENLYRLVTHWLPDDEPLTVIRHQVTRDLNLAGFLGADSSDDRIRISETALDTQLGILGQFGLKSSGYIVLHTGVSEKKRQYPRSHWIELARLISKKYNVTIALTGTANEQAFTEELALEMGGDVKVLSGKTDLSALCSVIKQARGMVTLNTGPMHLAAALDTPSVALYAQSNPQHKPYCTKSKVLEFSVPEGLQSKNEVIRFVNREQYADFIPYPEAVMVMEALGDLIDE
ncbi:MAG: glycosyltransferase family 9 protein [Pedobacter sp.]|nr:MAG: glycosyltransferase family 9 protein [Pedobacter sp.]